ncbi:MAG: hypothetical protein B6226_05730 [Candidatus Cloacimonetes bacterium 4572_65]|nr:MAG: hypothetical protein B6226_05730 [Candidatus Cloacimonetes bacterium 4572_65]
MYQKNEYFHALTIKQENCTGCTACVKVCPTEAIRIRNKEVIFDGLRCIDCGNCIEACNFNAITPYADSFKILENYKYKIAIFSTTFAGQFTEDIEYQTMKKTMLHIGFDQVFGESSVTEFTAEMIKHYVRENQDIRPVISSGCPAVVRLIQVRFPSLLPNLFHIEAPMSTLSYYLREQAVNELGYKDEEVGIFLIVPCVSQVTAVHQPEGTYKAYQDGAFSISAIYAKAQDVIKEARQDTTNVDTFQRGLTWAISGVEADKIDSPDIRVLSVSGIKNVIDILSKAEDHYLDQYGYIVVRSCTAGCVGGVLNVENPFIAMSRLKRLAKGSTSKSMDYSQFRKLFVEGKFNVKRLKPRSVMELDDNVFDALEKMKKINEIKEMLPGIDCCACGSPNCYALAEDIVQGKADIKDCVILYKQSKCKKREECK